MAPEHTMTDFSSRPSKSQVTVTAQSKPSTRSQPVAPIPIGLNKTPTGKACGAALGAIYYPIAGQTSADASSSSSGNTSLDRRSLPHSRSYENADTLEREDCSEGFHTAKGDKRLSYPAASSVGSLPDTNKVTRPITTFNPLDREKYKTAGKKEPHKSQGFDTHPGSHNVHSDMYSTAFALQSLGDGTWPSYLNKVRGIWDDQLQHHSADNIHEKSIMGNGTGGQARSKRSKSQGQYDDCQMFVPICLECLNGYDSFAFSLLFIFGFLCFIP